MFSGSFYLTDRFEPSSSSTGTAGSAGVASSTGAKKTSYPEFSFIEPPPKSNVLTFKEAKTYLSSKYDEGLAKAVFAVLWAEASKTQDRKAFSSAGGYNYAGVQTDSGRWGAGGIIGQYARRDISGRVRSFAVFKDNNGFLDFMASRIKAKGFSGINGDIWTTVYINSWWSPPEKGSYIKGTKVYKEKLSFYQSAMKRYNQ